MLARTVILMLALAGFALATALAVAQPQTQPATASRPGKTDWMHKAKWGVMIHAGSTLPKGTWAQAMDGFDVAALARQAHEVGAGYLMITSIHAEHPIAPSAVYEKRFPGKCPKRDLIVELADELAKYDLPLMLYFNTNIKWKPNDADVQFHADMLKEFSLRYGTKVKGWWFDNSFARHDPAMKIDAARNTAFQKLIAEAARAGNPNANLGFSPPHGTQRNTPFDDYTAGNLHKLNNVVCPGRFVDGCQWHTLCYLGTTWGSARPRYQGDEATVITKRLTDAGGAVTWDCPHDTKGRLTDAIVAQLKAVGKATGTLRQ
ncbi:MAG: alpha-L-fucosidase [Planctomycetaceae bacterium]|nr:alpha-L-fucosidase [Planctomycetaceae bacterium]